MDEWQGGPKLFVFPPMKSQLLNSPRLYGCTVTKQWWVERRLSRREESGMCFIKKDLIRRRGPQRIAQMIAAGPH